MLFRIFLAVSPGFSPVVIIGNGDALIIKQYTLQPPVRADGCAYNLPYIGEYTIKHQCKKDNGNKSANVLAYRISDDPPQGIHSNNISQKNVGDKKGNE